MAHRVREIMNQELFAVSSDDDADRVRRYLVALGITGAPVVDKDHHPEGFVSLRDLMDAHEQPVLMRMSAPPDCIDADATIEHAADVLAERNRHHLVCIDEQGRAIGMVSSIDIVRALRGHAVPHPDSFPHYDRALGLGWSNEHPLDGSGVEYAPHGPGLYVLILGHTGAPDEVVWSEASHDVRARLIDMLSMPHTAPPHLQDFIAHGQLRFKAASAPSARALKEAMDNFRGATRYASDEC